MRNTFINKIIESSKQRKDIFIISEDAGLGVFDEFQKDSPEQFLNLGVAEQNATSFAAGMSMAGFKVYLYNIIPFLLYRCYEQVRNDICYQKLPVVLAGIGSGVTYAPQGMTHYSVEDIGVAQTLPNLTVISPIDPVEAQKAAEYSLSAREPVYVRLAKRGEPKLHAGHDIDITAPILMREIGDIAIVFHGSIGTQVLAAAQMLEKEGINVKLISVPMVQPLNKERLLKLLESCKTVLCVEEHFIGCGLGSIIARERSRTDVPWKLFCLGIADRFLHEVKTTDGMRDYFGISADRIFQFIKGVRSKC